MLPTAALAALVFLAAPATGALQAPRGLARRRHYHRTGQDLVLAEWLVTRVE